MATMFRAGHSPPCITAAERKRDSAQPKAAERKRDSAQPKARRVAERSRRYREASADREAGVVFRWMQKGKPPRLRPLRWLRDIFLDDAATSPSFRLRAVALALRGGDARGVAL